MRIDSKRKTNSNKVMKANAPERLYLSKTIYSTYLYQVPDLDDETAVEYIHADTFIEKACEGIEYLLSGYIIRNFHFGDSYDIDRLKEDFKDYMKGE